MKSATKQEVASAYGVAVRTIERWLKAGLPHERDGEGGAPRLDLDAVRAWTQARGISARASASTADPAVDAASGADPAGLLRPLSTRDAAQRADAAKKIAQAKRQEHELQQERGLRELGLAERVREARSAGDLAELAREVTALVAFGALSPSRGQALRQLLAETRHALRARERESSAAADGRLVLVTDEARALAEGYDRLVNGWRRAWLRDALAGHAVADTAEFPPERTDEGARRLTALGLDLHGEPLAGAASPYPAPTVPAVALAVAPGPVQAERAPC